MQNDSKTTWALTWKANAHRQHIQLADCAPVLVGRKHPSHVLIDEQHFSGVHCCVVRIGPSIWAIDLGSTNGTLVGESSGRCNEIPPGKSLRVASSRIHAVRLHTDKLNDDLNQEIGFLVSAIDERDQSLQTQADELRQAHETIATRDATIAELEQTIVELRNAETELETQKSQNADLAAKIDEQQTLREQLERGHADAIEAMQATLKQREEELDRLQRELVTERHVLSALNDDIEEKPVDAINVLPDDEACIGSLDFQHVLEEALEALPPIGGDEVRPNRPR